MCVILRCPNSANNAFLRYLTKLAMLTQPYTHAGKKIMTRARNNNASIESRKTQVKHRSFRTRRTKIKIDLAFLNLWPQIPHRPRQFILHLINHVEISKLNPRKEARNSGPRTEIPQQYSELVYVYERGVNYLLRCQTYLQKY